MQTKTPNVIDTLTDQKAVLEAEQSRLLDRIAADTAQLDQTEAELARANAALSVLQAPAPTRRVPFTRS